MGGVGVGAQTEGLVGIHKPSNSHPLTLSGEQEDPKAGAEGQSLGWLVCLHSLLPGATVMTTPLYRWEN